MLAIPIGLIVGMMPGVALSVATLVSIPILIQLDFNQIISFFVCIGIASQFSNSVIAIYAGIPGDFTALPIVSERKNLLKYYSIKENLFRTATASSIGTLIGILFTLAFFMILSPYSKWLMRSETLFIVLIIIILGGLFWPMNKFLTNVFLVFTGSFIGIIGYYPTFQVDILTFGNSYLYSGIPVMAGLLALYAFPNVINLSATLKTAKLTNSTTKTKQTPPKFFYANSLMGASIGCVCGLIPLISAWSASSTAYTISKRINAKSINHAICSESANSAAYVTLIAPLLVFGVAIIPSEVILIELLRFEGWTAKSVNYNTFFVLIIMSIITILVSYSCSTFMAKSLVQFMIKNHNKLLLLTFSLLFGSLYFMGKYTSELEMYFLTFFVLCPIGLIMHHRKIDPLPLIFSWGIISIIIHYGYRITQLHF